MRRLLVLMVVVGLATSILATPAAAAGADLAWKLPFSDVHQVLADNARHRVLITADSSVVAMDPGNGTILDRLDGLTSARVIVSGADDDKVWVSTSTAFVEITLDGLEVVRSVPLPDGWCSNSAAFAYSRIWVSDSCGDKSIGSFQPESGSPIFETDLAAGIGPSVVPALLMAPPSGDGLYVSRVAEPGRYTLVAGQLTLAASLCCTQVMVWDSRHEVVLAVGVYTANLLDPVSLTTMATVSTPVGTPAAAAAALTTDRFVVSDGSTHTVFATDGRSVDATYSNPLEAGGITWVDDSLVFATDDAGVARLQVRRDADRTTTSLTLQVASFAVPGEAMKMVGELFIAGRDAPAGISITISRVVGEEETILGTTTTDSSGDFSWTDVVPDTPSAHPAKYVAAYSGTAEIQPSSAVATPVIIAMPWDFNGDGYEDSAVGIPLEDIGSIKNAGVVHVSYGGPDGLRATGTQSWHQDTPGVVGTAEANDQFGYAVTSADYNRDGFADLFVSANNEGRSKKTLHCGNVTFLPGGPTGLVAKGSVAHVPNPDCAGSYAGEAVAAFVDKHGDRSLYVGAPGRDVVYWTDDQDLGKPAYIEIREGEEVPGKDRQYPEAFGETLASGDFNGDGQPDLAIGIPYDYDDRGYASGAVGVVYGGPKPPKNQRFSLDSTSIAGTPHSFSTTNASDQFGYALAAGDLNGDGIDDLAIGVPGMDTARSNGKVAVDGGQVTVLLGSANRLNAADSWRITQESVGVVGGANSDDFFGTSLAIDNDRPGANATLFVGEWGVQAVHVLPAGHGTGSVRIRQESAGVPSSTEAEDGFGWFIRTVHDHGFDAPAGLLVGAPGENGYGALFTLPSTGSGVTGAGSVVWTENTAGIPGTSEAGDYYGWLGSSR